MSGYKLENPTMTKTQFKDLSGLFRWYRREGHSTKVALAWIGRGNPTGKDILEKIYTNNGIGGIHYTGKRIIKFQTKG